LAKSFSLTCVDAIYDRTNKLYKDLYGDNPELLVRYGWIYPVNDNSTGSGVGGRSDDLQKSRGQKFWPKNVALGQREQRIGQYVFKRPNIVRP